jgi:hypothetical protein
MESAEVIRVIYWGYDGFISLIRSWEMKNLSFVRKNQRPVNSEKVAA